MIGRLAAATGAAIVGGVASTLGRLFQIDIRRRWRAEIALPPLCHFTPQQSVGPGDALRVFAHCEQPAKLTIRRMGATKPAPVHTSDLPATVQDNHYDYWRGLEWSPTLSIPVTPDWVSGVYLLELASNDQTLVPYRQTVVVRPEDAPAVAVVVSTNTWAAYNDFGGLSNYRDWATPRPLREMKRLAKALNWRIVVGNRRSLPATPLSFFRPNDAINQDLLDLSADPITEPSHLARAEMAVLRHLDQLGVTYGVYSDHDIAFGSVVDEAALLIFTAHSEYWSEEMMGRFLAAMNRGGRALFLSGNHWYRRVKFLDRGLEVVDDRVDASQVAASLGTGYTADGYETYAPYRVTAAAHPVFAGTGLNVGDVFAAGPNGGGGSGYETDKVHRTSTDVEVLAVGANEEGPAFLVWKTYPNDGWICNFSSVAIAPWVERCDYVSQIVQNTIELSAAGTQHEGETADGSTSDKGRTHHPLD